MPWIASTFTVAALAGLFVVGLKHGLTIRRMLVKGERFVLHHMAFDTAVIAFIGMVFVFTRSAGIIR